MILYSDQATDKIKSASKKLRNAVAVTLGPKGRNVFISNKDGRQIVNDGITIAENLKLDDPVENEIAKVIIEAAKRTNKDGGDGTTTTIILSDAFLNAGLEEIKTRSPMEVREEMQELGKKITDAIASKSRKVETIEDLKKVAYISSEHEEISQKTAELMNEIGSNGVVDIEEGEKPGINVVKKLGFDFDGVPVSPYLPRELSDNVPVLVVDYKIRSRSAVHELLVKIQKTGEHRLAIICDDIDSDVLGFLATNSQKGIFHTLVVKVENFNKFEHLEDIAALCGTTILSSGAGVDLASILPEQLGTCDKIRLPTIQDKESKTVIIRKGANVEEHVKKLEQGLETAFDKSRMFLRIAKLKGGVATFSIGTQTPSEYKYLKLKVEDAINSVRSAMTDGVVDGGAISLVRAAASAGFLGSALIAPFWQLFANSGYLNEKGPDVKGTFDHRKGVWVDDAFEAGVIDATKVVCSAVRNAIAVSSILLTTSVIYYESA